MESAPKCVHQAVKPGFAFLFRSSIARGRERQSGSVSQLKTEHRAVQGVEIGMGLEMPESCH